VLAGGLAALVAGIGGGLVAMAQTTFQPSEFATFAGIVWLAILVTIGIRSTAAALVAGLALVMPPALLQAYAPSWTANLVPVFFGLGAIAVARYPDGVLAEQGRRARRLMLRLAPHRLGGPQFVESVNAGSSAPQPVEAAPLMVEQVS
jgi:branched-chain amino acid transport system permease protein